jgi:predicted esterase
LEGREPALPGSPGNPAFLLARDKDEIVPKAHSERMLAALQKAGVPAN